MQKQDAVVWSTHGPKDNPEFDDRFRGSTVLEYTTLLGHVLVEDQLKVLLAARLGSDTLPPLRGFEAIAGLALAGTGWEARREAAGWLNVARNEVGHRLHRRRFLENVKRFVGHVNGPKRFSWPSKESEQSGSLRLAIRVFLVDIAMQIEREQMTRKLGDEGFASYVAAAKARRKNAS